MTEQPLTPLVIPPAVGQSEMERILRDMDRRIRNMENAFTKIGGISGVSSGAWNTAPVSNGTGIAMVLPAGILRMHVGISGFFTVGGGAMQIQIYFDGVYQSDCYLFFNVINTHLALVGGDFTVNIKAGTHYLNVRQLAGVADSNDRIEYMGIVLPT